LESSRNSRRFFRFRLPALVEAPQLSGQPFEVEDISAGGFMAVLPRAPKAGVKYDISVRLGEALFGPYEALAAWNRQVTTRPAAWSFGMLIKMLDEEREDFADAISAMLGSKV